MAYQLHVQGKSSGVDAPVLGRITTCGTSYESRNDHVFLDPQAAEDVTGYAGILLTRSLSSVPQRPTVHSVPYRDHLDDGDVVVLNPGGFVRTLYKRNSPHNALFTTDRCNSFCLMCSQPPKAVDDRDRIHEHLRLIDLMQPAPRELGITGGEPTLLGRDLIRILEACKEKLPATGLHILSNGRLFCYEKFARDLAAVEHPDLVVGIPLYSDIDYLHDFVVQARGAFEQTLLGLQNLGRCGVRVEIRVVIHRLTYMRLPQLAEFIYRNLTFTDHVALMGLEPIGFAVPNLASLWIDPYDYQQELRGATLYLAARGLSVSIYNHQLCTVPRELWAFCRKSISDWKNDYLPQCESCGVRHVCAGFFSSAPGRGISTHIEPIAAEKAAVGEG
jgi:His-Xaa-Ser system radical SAM maturase HxsC